MCLTQTRLVDPTRGPNSWTQLVDQNCGPNLWTQLVDPTRGLDLWSLKNKELFQIGLVERPRKGGV